VRLRPYDESDFAAVHGLMDEVNRRFRGEPFGEAELRTWLSTPTLDIANDIRLAERDGTLVGYADVDCEGEPPLWWCDVQVKPEEPAGPLAAALLEWLDGRIHGGRVRVWASAANAPLREVFEHAGFSVRRYSYSMELQLERLQPPAWPEGITLRTYREGDGPIMYEVTREVWLDTWSPFEESYEQWAHWAIERESFDAELFLIAEADGEVAGFAQCSRSDRREDTGWVDVLGVRRGWRRRGLGEALLRHAFERFSVRGLTRAGLGVDAESPTGATRLYERVGMRVYHETVFYERELES
jgi:mycothiol synthase